jgi:hypothetical protein
MYDHRNTRETRCQPSNKSSLGRVCVDDSIAFTPQECGQTDEAAQVPQRTYFPPDDIQIYKTQTMLSYSPLENEIGGKNVNLPPLSPSNLT